MTDIAREIATMAGGEPERTSEHVAEVLRVDDGGTPWVRIPGGADETPCNRTLASVQPGDTVTVRIESNRATITGNLSAPAVGQQAVVQAVEPVQRQVTQMGEVVAQKADFEELNALSAHVGELEADAAKVHSLTADQLAAAIAYIAALTAGDVTAASLVADLAKVHQLTADELAAAAAYIAALDAGSVTAQDIVADHGDFGTVKANAAKVASLTAEELAAAVGYIAALIAGDVTAQQVIADHAVVDDLDARYAEIDLANVNNAFIDHGTFKTAAIVDEQVFTVTGNKATLAEINADVITVRNLHTSNLTVDHADGYVTIGSKKTPTKEFIDSLVDDLQDKIDATVETYTSTAVPLTNNYPASSWATDDERLKHVGDICFVTNGDLDQDGYCYRYAYDATSGEFSWVLIKDNDVTKALGDISDLQTFESETTSWMEETDEGLTTIRSNHTELSGRVDKVVKSSIQLWYTKANTTAPAAPTAQVTSTSTSGNAWRVVVPAYSDSYKYYYYCWQYQYEDGTFGWSAVVRDRAMEESQSTSRSAQTTANANIKSSVMLWFSKADDTAPAAPTAQVTSTATTGNAWTTVVPTWNGAYPHYFYCYQQQKGDGSWQWTDVVYDRATSEAQQKAAAALPASTFTTFETTTFKTLTDTVDEQGVAFSKLSETVQYGGKNLLKVDGAKATPTEYSGIAIYLSEPIEVEQEYTLQLWDVDVAHSAKSAAQLGVFAYYNGDAIRFGMWQGTDYFTDGHADHLVMTFTAHASANATTTAGTGAQNMSHANASVTPPFIRLYNSVPTASGTRNLTVGKWKLERGPFATPWEYAQDDVTTVSNKLNTVSDTVDGHTQTISSMQQTIAGKADGSTVSTLTTKVNNVSDTVDGHTSSLSSLTETVTRGSNLAVDTSSEWRSKDLTGGTNQIIALTGYTDKLSVPNIVGIKTDDKLWISFDLKFSSGTTKGTASRVQGNVNYPGTFTFADWTGGQTNCEADIVACLASGNVARISTAIKVTDSMLNGTYTGETYINIRFDGWNGTVYVRKVMVNLGEHPLPWTISSDTVSTLQQDYATFKQTTTDSLSEIGQLVTDAEGRITSAETAISQNSDAIALRATKTEAAQMAQANLAPLGSADFDSVYNATTNPKGYWKSRPTNIFFTQLDDGWVHVEYDNTSGSAAGNTTTWRPGPSPSVVPGDPYTILVEIRNNESTVSTVASFDLYLQQVTNNQFWGNTNGVKIDDDHVTTNTSIYPGRIGKEHVQRSYRIADTEHLTEGTSPAELFRYNFRVPAGCKMSFDMRMSVYEGIYDGPYKPYSGNQLYASQAELKIANDAIDLRVEKSGVIAAINASVEKDGTSAARISADKVNIEGAAIFSSGRLSTASLDGAYDAKGAADTALSDAKDYAEGVVSDTQGGYTILWNYSAFATANNGECYICKRDPLTETRTDEAGWVMWNGVKRTIPKGMVNPNAIHPFNIPCYVVCRLTSATATTGANYIVSYNSGWKGGVINAGALSDWTWNDATDIILGKFVMTAAEGAMVECELYNPPWSSKQITTNTVTAQGAAPKTSAVAEEQYIYISKAAGTASVSGTTTWVTASGDTQDAWTTKRPTYSGEYPVLFVAKQKKVVSGTVTCTTPMKDDTTTVIDGGHITTGEIDTDRLNVSDIKDEGDFVTGSELDVEADRISSTVGDLDAALSENVDGLESLAARMSAIEQTAEQIKTSVSNVEGDVTTLTQTDSALRVEIESAKKTATDYLTFAGSKLTLGASGNAVKAELSASQLAFVANGSTPASIGVEDGSGVLLIDNARVTDMLKFGDFAWIKRDNGNMTLKWIGA